MSRLHQKLWYEKKSREVSNSQKYIYFSSLRSLFWFFDYNKQCIELHHHFGSNQEYFANLSWRNECPWNKSCIVILDVSDTRIHEDIEYLDYIFARKSKYVMAILLNFPLQSQLNPKQVTKLSKSAVKTISSLLFENGGVLSMFDKITWKFVKMADELCFRIRKDELFFYSLSDFLQWRPKKPLPFPHERSDMILAVKL